MDSMNVRTREDFAQFVNEEGTTFVPGFDENGNLWDYFDAIVAVAALPIDFPHPDYPPAERATWQEFARIMVSATVYE